MTFSDFSQRFPNVPLSRFWDDSMAFNCLRLFWTEMLEQEPWFAEKRWQVDGLGSVERPHGDMFTESYGLTAGSTESWNQLRVRFTSEFVATAKLFYSVKVMDGTLVDIPSGEAAEADHLREFIKSISQAEMKSWKWNDLTASYVPIEIWVEGSKQDDVKLFISLEHTDETVMQAFDFLKKAAESNFSPDECHKLADTIMKERYGTTNPEEFRPEWERTLRSDFRRKLGFAS